MRYVSLGRIPAKRHVQYRDPDVTNGHAPLLVEEVMGFEGFSGNESILYHLFSPCRIKEVGDFERIELEEWVPETHVHRLTHTMELEPMGDSVLGRRVLQYNGDVEIAVCVPEREAEYFYRDGEGDEVIFVHEGAGVVETIFGTLPYRKHDYVVIPRGTTYRFRFDEPQRWLTFYTPGEIRTTCSTTTRWTSSAGTATSTRTRSTSTTSSPRPAACTSRRPRTRPSRARTS
jgi:homogentisate 1,2-dioxygenase